MVPGWTSAPTRGVNDLGQAVGYGGSTGSVPFLFDGISNNGIITGMAMHDGIASGFVMVPVPEPTVGSFAVISVALIGLALRTRRDAAH